MNNQEQILQLNQVAKANLGVSKVHGIGVIAITDIYEGEVVYADKMPKVYSVPIGSFGKLFPEVKRMILERWPSVVNNSKFIYPDARLVSFMNHSFEPNYDPRTDKAIKFIKKGEEVLEDYTAMPNYEKVWPLNKNTWLIATSVTKNP